MTTRLERFKSFKHPETSTVQDIITAIYTFLIRKSSEIYEIFCFNERVQEEKYPIELFYADQERLVRLVTNGKTRYNATRLFLA